MKFRPPEPLVTSNGKVFLKPFEIEAINQHLDKMKRTRSMRDSDAAVVDVLSRLLGHALGTMDARQDS